VQEINRVSTPTRGRIAIVEERLEPFADKIHQVGFLLY
jgi:hypothetical protein